MHKIHHSFFPSESHENAFQRLCNAHIEELRAHSAQMRMVKKSPETHHPYPAPSAHPDIMAAIVKDGDDFNVEYEVIRPTFEEKKSELVHRVSQAAMSAMNEVSVSPLKRRLAAMEIQEILSMDEKKLSKTQKRKLDDHNQRDKKINDIQLKLAQAESEIDDLTETKIDAWTMPSFEVTK